MARVQSLEMFSKLNCIRICMYDNNLGGDRNWEIEEFYKES